MKTETRPHGFLAADADFDQARFCLLGVPLDMTVSFRPGTRRGPEAIRQMSLSLEEFSLYQERDLNDISVADLGDLSLPTAGLPRALDLIEAAVYELCRRQKVPFLFGGEHLLSLPAIKAMAKVHGPDLVILHFDAHADMRKEYEGEKLSHATVMRQIAGLVPPANIYQFGIRSGAAEEIAYAKKHTNFYPFEVLQPLKKIRPALGTRPVYVSLDMDVFDPAFAPGVGTPEPGGQQVSDMLQAIQLLQGLNIVGADIVEVCPPFDQSERTAVLAALLVRELLLLWHK